MQPTVRATAKPQQANHRVSIFLFILTEQQSWTKKESCGHRWVFAASWLYTGSELVNQKQEAAVGGSTHLNRAMFFSNSSFSRWNSVMYFCCVKQACLETNGGNMNASSSVRFQMFEQSADTVPANQSQRVPTFFLSGSSLYFLDRILVRSRLLISG